jgi:hypothetical protein
MPHFFVRGLKRREESACRVLARVIGSKPIEVDIGSER